jgi:hypothetical protein
MSLVTFFRFGLCSLIVGLALGFGLRPAPAQDHLEPPTPFPEREHYWADLKQVFAQAYAPNVILRVFRLPGLEISDVVTGIRETNGSYEAFIITSSSLVSDLETVRKIKAGKINGVRPDGTLVDGSLGPYVRLVQETPASAAEFKTKREAASISARLAQRIAKIWQEELLAAKVPTKKREGLDGQTYSFSAAVEGRGTIIAEIWSPDTESRMERLISLVERLGKFARKQVGEEKVTEAVKDFEQQQINERGHSLHSLDSDHSRFRVSNPQLFTLRLRTIEL